MINAAEVFYRNPEDIAETGKMIQQQRNQMGLSQSELGMRMDVDGNSVYRYEQGYREMGITTFFQLAEVLGCGVEAISPERLRQNMIITEKARRLARLAEKLSESDQELLIRIVERMLEKP